jgi:hypothetical protein
MKNFICSAPFFFTKIIAGLKVGVIIHVSLTFSLLLLNIDLSQKKDSIIFFLRRTVFLRGLEFRENKRHFLLPHFPI